MRLFVFLVTAWAAFAAEPKVIYTKSFPGSSPAYVMISVQKDGAVSYNESTDVDNAENFKLEPGVVGSIFDYAQKAGPFQQELWRAG